MIIQGYQIDEGEVLEVDHETGTVFTVLDLIRHVVQHPEEFEDVADENAGD